MYMYIYIYMYICIHTPGTPRRSPRRSSALAARPCPDPRGAALPGAAVCHVLQIHRESPGDLPTDLVARPECRTPITWQSILHMHACTNKATWRGVAWRGETCHAVRSRCIGQARHSTITGAGDVQATQTTCLDIIQKHKRQRNDKQNEAYPRLRVSRQVASSKGGRAAFAPAPPPGPSCMRLSYDNNNSDNNDNNNNDDNTYACIRVYVCVYIYIYIYVCIYIYI